jgi:hypothetical protein
MQVRGITVANLRMLQVSSSSSIDSQSAISQAHRNNKKKTKINSSLCSINLANMKLGYTGRPAKRLLKYDVYNQPMRF